MITHVAIRFEGKVWSMPSPFRHHDVIKLIVANTDAQYVDAHGDDQGFLDAHGRYRSREEAYLIAANAGQVPRTQLYSEDLW